MNPWGGTVRILEKVKEKKKQGLSYRIRWKVLCCCEVLSEAMKKKPTVAFAAMNCDYQEDNSKEDKMEESLVKNMSC